LAKKKPKEKHTNQKLLNCKPVKGINLDGVQSEMQHRIVLDIANEDAFNSVFTKPLKDALEEMGFKGTRLMEYRPGEKMTINAVIRMDEGEPGDAPGQMKIGDDNTGHDGEDFTEE